MLRRGGWWGQGPGSADSRRRGCRGTGSGREGTVHLERPVLGHEDQRGAPTGPVGEVGREEVDHVGGPHGRAGRSISVRSIPRPSPHADSMRARRRRTLWMTPPSACGGPVSASTRRLSGTSRSAEFVGECSPRGASSDADGGLCWATSHSDRWGTDAYHGTRSILRPLSGSGASSGGHRTGRDRSADRPGPVGPRGPRGPRRRRQAGGSLAVGRPAHRDEQRRQHVPGCGAPVRHVLVEPHEHRR